MTTIFEKELLCPCCNHKFEGRGLGSTNTFGPKSTDFRTRAIGFDPLYVIIQTCSNCGFSGFEDDFQQGLDNAIKENRWRLV